VARVVAGVDRDRAQLRKHGPRDLCVPVLDDAARQPADAQHVPTHEAGWIVLNPAAPDALGVLEAVPA
jgi:hypothetical protein